MPHYGQVAAGMLQTVTAAVRDPEMVAVAGFAQSCSSVLPHCFNELLCHALAMRDTGQVTHFAMAHADVVAEPGWLDKLAAEMYSHDLTAISAVIPIKGPTGRTSTAIGDLDDPWKVTRCVFLHDRNTLPTTFTLDQVRRLASEVLLINTGLMLLDLGHPCWDDFAFQFHTRINRVQRDDGQVVYLPEQRTEDWEMSHHLRRHGARYGATWAVRLRHEGACRYPNYSEHATYTAAPDRPKWMAVDGWLTAEEGEALQRLAAGGRVLELGSWKGRSTCCMAEVAEHVTAVDTFEGDASAGIGDTYFDFLDAIEPHKDKVDIRREIFGKALPPMSSMQFDLVFIDDDHDSSTAYATNQAKRLVKPGGVIAWHDWPDPAVVDAARRAGLEPQAIVGSLAWTTVG